MRETFMLVKDYYLPTSSISSKFCARLTQNSRGVLPVSAPNIMERIKQSLSYITTEIPQQPKYSLLPHEQIYYVEYSNRSIPKL